MSLNWFASLGLITMRFLAHFVVVVAAFCIRVSYLLFGFGFVIALTKQFFSVCARRLLTLIKHLLLPVVLCDVVLFLCVTQMQNAK